MIRLAKAYADTRAPYQGRMSNGLGEPTDCSGLTLWVYKTAGFDLRAWMPHVQANNPHFRAVSEADAVPGDLVFRVRNGSQAPYTRPTCHHAGIYMGNHTVIEERWGGCTWDSLDINFDTPGSTRCSGGSSASAGRRARHRLGGGADVLNVARPPSPRGRCRVLASRGRLAPGRVGASSGDALADMRTGMRHCVDCLFSHAGCLPQARDEGYDIRACREA